VTSPYLWRFLRWRCFSVDDLRETIEKASCRTPKPQDWDARRPKVPETPNPPADPLSSPTRLAPSNLKGVAWTEFQVLTHAAFEPLSRAALRAAGAACRGVDQVVSGTARAVFCLVRPPGHHAGELTNGPSSRSRTFGKKFVGGWSPCDTLRRRAIPARAQR
jgi:hypothetical protein